MTSSRLCTQVVVVLLLLGAVCVSLRIVSRRSTPVTGDDGNGRLAHLHHYDTVSPGARTPSVPRVLSARRPSFFDVFDFTRLPSEMHPVLSLLLLMPFGALVTCIFRTFVGVRTFGTFTPTLLALSFVFADWRTGLVVFALVLMLGLISRSLIDRLKLMMVPRLSVVLTLVVLCMIFAVSVLDSLRVTPGPQAVLLPMVILTMLTERFYLTAEEDSTRFALQLLGGTLLVAFFCYLVLGWEKVGQILLAYPELHFFTVAALITIGRYTGYRLTELWRFRNMVDSSGM